MMCFLPRLTTSAAEEEDGAALSSTPCFDLGIFSSVCLLSSFRSSILPSSSLDTVTLSSSLSSSSCSCSSPLSARPLSTCCSTSSSKRKTPDPLLLVLFNV
ncbi:unnamed protein product [Amoebophrya sp. A25]|nr:unnamed protein product [Amoebophrya sp. A25]|eukprot:GSA25T00025786001.1